MKNRNSGEGEAVLPSRKGGRELDTKVNNGVSSTCRRKTDTTGTRADGWGSGGGRWYSVGRRRGRGGGGGGRRHEKIPELPIICRELFPGRDAWHENVGVTPHLHHETGPRKTQNHELVQRKTL